MPNSEADDNALPGFEDGAKLAVLVNKYERNKKNRELCIKTYGAICRACDFDFSKFYGEIGQGYIHVHHLISLAAQKGKARRIDPVKDLRPVCPNCHEMLHTEDPPLTIEHLRALIADAKGKAS
jgi:5-methylcytosine-specific restriction protein A